MKFARHSLYNLVGLGVPLLAGLVSIPFLIKLLGVDRFGLLTLVWAVTSYFGLIDLGLGRALTQQLAVALQRGDKQDAAALSGTAMLVMAVLGTLAGLIMIIGAAPAVDSLGQLPDRSEATHAVRIMGLCLPFIVCTTGLRGILEARHDFAAVNVIRLPLGLWTFCGPWWACASFGPDLVVATASLAVGRVVACLAHWWALNRREGVASSTWTIDCEVLAPLLRSGGWITLSNVVSPFMGYVDRFVIAGVVSASAVAFYATPLDLVVKLSIFPAAVSAALFPAVAALLADGMRDAIPVTRKALHWLMLSMVLTALPIALFADELLTLWLGPDFAMRSGPMLKLFCAGIALNALAHVPLALLQGSAAVRVPALIHLVELPVYLVALYALVSTWGERGAAIAWMLRISLDAALLFVACSWRLRVPLRQWLGPSLPASACLLAAGFSAAIVDAWLGRAVAWGVISILVLWLWLKDDSGQAPGLRHPG